MNTTMIGVIAAICAVAIAGGVTYYVFDVYEADDSIEYTQIDSIKGLTIEYVSGTENAYSLYSNSYGENTVRFNGISDDSTYRIYGVLNGNIEFNIDSDDDFILELAGLKVTSNHLSPVSVQTGSIEISLTAENWIGDMRDETSDRPYALYSSDELKISGNGTLNIHSTHNSGVVASGFGIESVKLNLDTVGTSITSTDDFESENSELYLTSNEASGILCNKDVSIDGGIVSIRSSSYGISAVGDVDIDEADISIHTADMSSRSDQDAIFVGYANNMFTFSLKVKDKEGNDVWINPSGNPTLVHKGLAKNYVYNFKVAKDVRSITIYAYTGNQHQGQDTNYYSKSDVISTGFDRNAFLITECTPKISYELMNYDGPKSPDYDRMPTAGISSDSDISIDGGKIVINSNGDSIFCKGEIGLDDVTMTSFSRNNNISCQSLDIDGGKIVLISSGKDGSPIRTSDDYECDDTHVIAICTNNDNARKDIENCDDFEDIATVKIFSGLKSGDYIQVTKSDNIQVIVTIPNNKTGMPPMKDEGFKAEEGPGSEPMDFDVPAEMMDTTDNLVIYIGSNNANITNPGTVTVELDEDGIYWGI